jgi:hypothetical protein
MTDHGSTIRMHYPFTNAKHWVCGPADGYTLTDNLSDACRYSHEDVVRILDALQRQLPSASIEVMTCGAGVGRSQPSRARS